MLMMNKCRLAAVSNYKLAQLTFSSLDHGSLQKTALIKNLLVQLYENEDYDMTRWAFFTPESLENMTQRDIERIIQRYTQLICTQSPIQINDRTSSFYYPNPNYHYNDLDKSKRDESESNNAGATITTTTTMTYAKNLATELMNLFDMEFCLDLSLPSYRQSLSFDEPRYPSHQQYDPAAALVTPPKRVSSLEYRRSRSEPSLIGDDDDDDDIKSVSTNSIDTIELELEVDSSSRTSVLSDLFSFMTHTSTTTTTTMNTTMSTPKRQGSIKRFFSSFSSKEENNNTLIIPEQQQQRQQNEDHRKLTRSKSVGTKLLKRIKSFKTNVNQKA